MTSAVVVDWITGCTDCSVTTAADECITPPLADWRLSRSTFDLFVDRSSLYTWHHISPLTLSPQLLEWWHGTRPAKIWVISTKLSAIYNEVRCCSCRQTMLKHWREQKTHIQISSPASSFLHPLPNSQEKRCCSLTPSLRCPYPSQL